MSDRVTELALVGGVGERVLLPTDRYEQYEEDLRLLRDVTTVGQLRRFLLERPELGQYVGGPGDPADADWALQWAEAGEADEESIPWSASTLAEGDYPFPPPYAALALNWLDERDDLNDLVAELMERGCLEYEEVGGPLEWVTVPDEKVEELIAYAEEQGFHIRSE